jgi:hypothetical protein
MNRLPSDLDLSFFKDKPLFQVCIGANELILNFDDYVSITVTSRIGLTGILASHDTYEDFSKAAPAVVALLNDVVVAAEGDSAGTLTLTFRSGIKLEFYDTSDHYESYLVKNGDKVIVV